MAKKKQTEKVKEQESVKQPSPKPETVPAAKVETKKTAKDLDMPALTPDEQKVASEVAARKQAVEKVVEKNKEKMNTGGTPVLIVTATVYQDGSADATFDTFLGHPGITGKNANAINRALREARKETRREASRQKRHDRATNRAALRAEGGDPLAGAYYCKGCGKPVLGGLDSCPKCGLAVPVEEAETVTV